MEITLRLERDKGKYNLSCAEIKLHSAVLIKYLWPFYRHLEELYNYNLKEKSL